MEAKIALLWPEIVLFATTCVVMVVGLSRTRGVRVLSAPITVAGLVAAGVVALLTTPVTAAPLPELAQYAKPLVAFVGVLLAALMAGTADREYEAALGRGAAFDPLRSNRAEFYSFLLFSVTGLMLCAGSTDLVFLFLALELTSLPTYVMVTLSTGRNRSMEAGVKYFFLGAMGAAIFLYGFALIYGGTGTTDLAAIQQSLLAQTPLGGSAGVNDIAMIGLVLAVVGICFKIAAVPMHFYTPDVYQGAATPVAAFLAFVPKAAGFFAIMLLVSTVGWRFGAEGGPGSSLPETLRVLLWVIAALTMTLGNVLALMQNSVKRMLAYSSIAHSGYMLVGVIAGPLAATYVVSDAGAVAAAGSAAAARGLASNGLGAVLFYLLTYGVMTTGAFAVLAALERRRADGTVEEADDIDDLRGLWRSRPLLAAVMVICAFSLLGLPPLLGFLGKVPLVTSAWAAGEAALLVVLLLNSAIAAGYYLRLVFVPLLDKPETAPNAPAVRDVPFVSRRVVAALAALGVVVLSFVGAPFGRAAAEGGRFRYPGPSATAVPARDMDLGTRGQVAPASDVQDHGHDH